MAEISGGNIHFGIVADDESFKRDVKKDADALVDLGDHASKAGKKIAESFAKIDASNITAAEKKIDELKYEMEDLALARDHALSMGDKKLANTYSSDLGIIQSSYNALSEAVNQYRISNKAATSEAASMAASTNAVGTSFIGVSAESAGAGDAISDAMNVDPVVAFGDSVEDTTKKVKELKSAFEGNDTESKELFPDDIPEQVGNVENAIAQIRKTLESKGASSATIDALLGFSNEELEERIRESSIQINSYKEEISKIEDKQKSLKFYKTGAGSSIDSDQAREARSSFDELEKEKKSLQDRVNMQDELRDVMEQILVVRTELNNQDKNGVNIHAKMSTKLREVTNGMAQLAFEGKKDTDQYRELEAEAGKLKDALADAQKAAKVASSDTANLDAAMGAMSLGSGVIEGLTGAMGLFGASTKDAAEMQTSLQSAMALAQGVQQAQLALQKESAVMQGVLTIKTKAKAAADRMATKSTIAATVAQKAFNFVAKQNPYVLLAMALVTVVGALAAFVIGNNKAIEKQRELTELEGIEIEYLKNLAKARRDVNDEGVRGLENELKIAQARQANTNNIAETRRIEDELYKARKKANAEEIKDSKGAVDNIQKNRDALKKLQGELKKIEDASAKGKSKVKLAIDGDVKKVDIEKAKEVIQKRIDNYGQKIEWGVKLKTEQEQIENDRAVLEEKRRKENFDKAKNNAKTTETLIRESINLELQLMSEGWEKEDKIRNAAYDKSIADLKYRLKWEVELTKKQREEMIKQIKLTEQVRAKAQKEADEKRKRELREWNDNMSLKYAEMSYDNLFSKTALRTLQYEIDKRKLDDEKKASTTTSERKSQIDQELKYLLDKYMYDIERINDETRSAANARVVEMAQLEIDATKDKNKMLLELNKQLLDAQMQQELDAVDTDEGITAEKKASMKSLIRSKYRKQKDALDTDAEVKKYSTIAGYVNNIADAMGDVADGMDNGALKSFISAFRQVASLSDTIAENIKSTTGEDGSKSLSVDWAAAGPSLIASAFNMVLSTIVNSVKEMQELNAKSKEWVNTLELAKYQLEDIYSSAFGEDVYTKSGDAAKKAKEAQKAYENALAEANKTGTWWSTSRWNAGWYKGTKLGTRKLSSGNTLAQTMPELFNEDGSVNVDNIQYALDVYGDMMDSTTKEMLQNILNLKNAAEENTDYVTSYIADAFGDLSNSLMDGIVNAVETGADSWGDFEDAGKDAIEGLIKKMAYSTFLKPIFDAYAEELKGIEEKKGKGELTEDEYIDEQMRLLNTYYDKLVSGARNATEWIRGIANNGTIKGLFTGEGTETMAGSIQNVTEQTASIIAGQMNAIRMQQVDSNSILRSQLQILSGIKSDTVFLRSIDAKLEGLQYNIRTINA